MVKVQLKWQKRKKLKKKVLIFASKISIFLNCFTNILVIPSDIRENSRRFWMQTMYYIEYISLAREGVFMVTKLNLYVYCFIGLVSKRGDMCALILDSFLLMIIFLPRRTHFNWGIVQRKHTTLWKLYHTSESCYPNKFI